MYMIKSLALVACMVIFGSGCASNVHLIAASMRASRPPKQVTGMA